MTRPSSDTQWRILAGITVLVVMLATDASFGIAAEPAPPASPPTVQEDKGKAEGAGKIKERGVKRTGAGPVFELGSAHS